jgi:hypothetical protein
MADRQGNELKRMKSLEEENRRLTNIVAEQLPDKMGIQRMLLKPSKD